MADRFPEIERVQLSHGPEEGLRMALEMYELGIELTRVRLRRDHPGWSDEQVEQALKHWLRNRGLDGWRDGFRVRFP